MSETKQVRRTLLHPVALSILLHVLLIMVVIRFAQTAPRSLQVPRSSEPMWVDLTRPTLPEGREIVDLRAPANRRRPDSARHLSRRDHDARREMRRRDTEPNPAGRSARPAVPPEPARPRAAPPPTGSRPVAPTGPPVSSLEMLSRGSFANYLALRGRGGAYNPEADAQGDAIDIDTEEFRYLGYMLHLKERIEGRWNGSGYPIDRERTGRLAMTVLGTGELADVTLTESCGDRTLDWRIIRAIRDASPYNPLPRSWNEDHLTVNFTFHYLLENRSGLF